MFTTTFFGHDQTRLSTVTAKLIHPFFKETVTVFGSENETFGAVDFQGHFCHQFFHVFSGESLFAYLPAHDTSSHAAGEFGTIQVGTVDADAGTASSRIARMMKLSLDSDFTKYR